MERPDLMLLGVNRDSGLAIFLRVTLKKLLLLLMSYLCLCLFFLFHLCFHISLLIVMLQFLAAFVAMVAGLLLFMGFGGAGSTGSQKKETAMDPDNFQSFELVNRTAVSPDSYIFRFALHKSTQIVGLPIGQHIVIRAPIKNEDGKEELVMHSYTPISSDDDKGYVDFLIKVYLPCECFPKGGRLTQYLYNMKIGDKIDMRGPQGKFTYLGRGNFAVDRAGTQMKQHVDAFAMIAGGSGITPMMQIIRAIHKDAADKTQCYLVFANRSDKDILLREELDELAKTDDRFHVWYTVSRDVSPDWKYSTGFINEEMLRAHVPVPSSFGSSDVPQNKGIKSAAGLMCGPLPMIKNAVKPNLEKLGYTSKNLFTF
eukprot:gene4269-3087_t